jgi:hypothetical protein
MPRLKKSECVVRLWWQGPCACAICGYRCVAVVELVAGTLWPIVAMECAGCGNFALHPEEEE